MTRSDSDTQTTTDSASTNAQPTDQVQHRDQNQDHPQIPLEAIDLEHRYGSVTVLEGLSLEVSAGTVTALIGPNGSGKTTLLRILTGVLSPTSGTIRYRGPDTVRSIGYLQQQPAFRSGFTAEETLRFYASLVGEDETVAVDHLERVGLGEAADRNVEDLSGGMTRLLGIAQATIGDPPVVILDEPGSGLDPGMSGHLFDVASGLAADGAAVLLSSHDLGLVERGADHVALLDRGRIVQRGAPDTLCDQLGTESLLEVYEASVTGEAGTVRVRGEST